MEQERRGRRKQAESPTYKLTLAQVKTTKLPQGRTLKEHVPEPMSDGLRAYLYRMSFMDAVWRARPQVVHDLLGSAREAAQRFMEPNGGGPGWSTLQRSWLQDNGLLGKSGEDAVDWECWVEQVVNRAWLCAKPSELPDGACPLRYPGEAEWQPQFQPRAPMPGESFAEFETAMKRQLKDYLNKFKPHRVPYLDVDKVAECLVRYQVGPQSGWESPFVAAEAAGLEFSRPKDVIRMMQKLAKIIGIHYRKGVNTGRSGHSKNSGRKLDR